MSGEHIGRVGRVGRAAPLVGLAGRTAGEAVVASLRRRRKGGDTKDFRERDAERYASHLGSAKGVLMKAGQILSFSALGPSMAGADQSVYQRALERLQDNAPPMPYDVVAGVVERELGAPVEQIFAEFDPVPVGAASIGQVHEARLFDGRHVAVKVQYPGVDRAIRADLANTELLATFLQIAKGLQPALTRIDIKSLVREISDRIGDEIDYRIEAANQAEFALCYRGHPFIHIPEVVSELTTSRVLTMDFVEGKRFSEAQGASEELRDKWGEAILRFAFGSIRKYGLFNADPHPGNYLFHDDGTVTFIDFGCVKRFGPEQVRTVQRLAIAMVDNDGNDVIEALRSMGVWNEGAMPPAEEIVAFFRVGFESMTDPQPFTYTREYATRVVQQKFSPVGEHSDVLRSVSLDADFTMLMRIDLGVTSVLGALGCTGPYAAITAEFDRGGPPATPMGEAVATWERRHEYV
jgi:predicted unusual protein kinase regulating ubiquinone biosynthesis (AarF/ABC1/UbiB family)